MQVCKFFLFYTLFSNLEYTKKKKKKTINFQTDKTEYDYSNKFGVSIQNRKLIVTDQKIIAFKSLQLDYKVLKKTRYGRHRSYVYTS